MKHVAFPSIRSVCRITLLFSLFLVFAASAQAQTTLAKTFTPSTIGPGSVSTLQFTITTSAGIRNAAFTDNLPAGMIIASPANAVIGCSGSVSAPDGGSIITVSGTNVPPGSCVITVDVTSSTVGTLTNTTSSLTYEDRNGSPGTSGPATADLIVTADRPGFTKSFSPDVVFFGDRTTLTLTIDNSLNASSAFGLTFTDDLPAGMEVAGPSNASTDCGGGILTAPAGGSVISYAPAFPGDATVGAGAICTVVVDVVGSNVGVIGNTTSELISTVGTNFNLSSGKASANLTVTFQQLVLEKSFADDPVAPGGNVTLEFTIRNLDRNNSANNIAFTDDLDAVISGLEAVGLPASACGGTISGTGFLSFTGGTLAAEGTCTFSINLLVPATAATGSFLNTTSSITADIGGRGVTGDPASDLLFVEPVPVLTKTFLDAGTLLPDPVVGPGDDVIVRFTVTNTSSLSGATDVAFFDELTTFLPFPVSVVLPADPCGVGSSIALVTPGLEQNALSLTGGTLTAAPGAGSTCSFDVTLVLPTDLAAGTYTNITEPVTATIDGATVTGNSAIATFDVVEAPGLDKEFIDDPAPAGGTVTLQFTLIHEESAPGAATGITFTDDLAATLTGLVATGLPLTDVCGAGNGTLAADVSNTQLTFSDATLAPGEECTFSVTLDVPAGAIPGSYTNTTSNVMANVLGVDTINTAASDDLNIAGLELTKEFTDDPVVSGDSVNLRFTIENTSVASTASNITFTDNLSGALTGLATIPTNLVLNDVCGPGNGTLTSVGTFLSFSGASLAAGDPPCVIDVPLQVPANAATGTYLNVTSNLTASILGASSVVFDPAADSLEVIADRLILEKEFIDDPVGQGDPVTLRFTLTNLSSVDTISDVAFSDDLGAALPGLLAASLPITACGGIASTSDGGNTIEFSGGSLAPLEVCFFDVTLVLPGTAPLGTAVTNITSAVTGTIDGNAITGDPATADLQIDSNLFSKSFDSAGAAGGEVTLTFSIENLDADDVDVDLRFSDDLDAVIPGLNPLGLPLVDICGEGSMLEAVEMDGATVLLFTGGTLLAGGSCTFSVDLEIPADIEAGDYLNTTSNLQQEGVRAAGPASATLTIEPPPVFSKSFSPDTIDQGTVSTLTLVIDNSASALAASDLDFTDVFPAGLVIADPANALTNCAGGALTAVVGTDTVAYTGGTVAAGATCSVWVDVTAPDFGTFDNVTGDLTSSSGNSGTASATLTVLEVVPPPAFSKSFSPDTIDEGAVSTLTLVIDNSAGSSAADALDFTDVFPTGLLIADPANASTDCTGGSLTAVAGTDTVAYTGGSVAAGASCSVSVNVTAAAAGSYDNVTGDLTSSLGNSGTASATLVVEAVGVGADLTVTKTDSADPVQPGDTFIYTIVVTNNGPQDATRVISRDRLPDGLTLVSTTGCNNDPAALPKCKLGTIPSGTSKEYTIEVTVDDDDSDSEDSDSEDSDSEDSDSEDSDSEDSDSEDSDSEICEEVDTVVLLNRVRVWSRDVEDTDNGNNRATEETTVEFCDDDDEDSDSEDSDSEDSDSEN